MNHRPFDPEKVGAAFVKVIGDAEKWRDRRGALYLVDRKTRSLINVSRDRRTKAARAR